MKKYFFLLIVILLVPFVVDGQVVVAGSSEIGLVINPSLPGPEATTTIKIVSYAFDLAVSDIAWTINGRRVSVGRGQKDLSFRTGLLGKSTEVIVSVLNDGRRFEKKITFYQNEVTLLWEVLVGYAPGFYDGKIFPSLNSSVRVVAQPNIFSNGQLIPPEKLTYRWSKNFKITNKDSGLGKNTFIFTADVLTNNNIIEVAVTPANRPEMVIKKSVVIPTLPMEIVVYETKPLVGPLYGRGLKNDWRPAGWPVSLRAEVFNLSRSARLNLDFDWRLNNQPVAVDNNDPATVFIDQTISTSSRASLTVTAQNPLNIFDSAKEFLTIYLGSGVQF